MHSMWNNQSKTQTNKTNTSLAACYKKKIVFSSFPITTDLTLKSAVTSIKLFTGAYEISMLAVCLLVGLFHARATRLVLN